MNELEIINIGGVFWQEHRRAGEGRRRAMKKPIRVRSRVSKPATPKNQKTESVFFNQFERLCKERGISTARLERESGLSMPAQWTGDIIGKLHTNGISHKELAAAVGWNPKYMSVVLNGHKNPKGAKEKLTTALDGLIRAREAVIYEP